MLQGAVSRTARALHTVRRLGLHARLTAAFALGALVLSLLLAALAYGLVRDNLVEQRERDATNELYGNARAIRPQLRGSAVDPRDLLDNLRTPGGASPVLFFEGKWYGLDVDRARKELRETLRAEVVDGGRPSRMRYRLDGESVLAIGVPLPAVDAAYFEIVSLNDLDGTLSSLLLSLGAAALLTTLAGAGLGAAFSHRVLRPLAEVRQAAVAIAGGRLNTRVATVDDADLGALVASFNDMARALQERIERDARFASDVSHELRSPLMTLSASIEILEGRRDELPERSRAALDLMVADVRRFSAMVEDLLEISRFDAGAASLDLDDVQVAELTRNAVFSARRGDVPVRVVPGAENCVVQADKRRLVRVITNLLDNADRYAGGAIGIVVERAGDDVRLAVEDAGPGVVAEDRDRIFERFARGTSAGRRTTGEGVGLGLALVREHVALHGGRVWVEDRNGDGPGARFVVELPGQLPEPEPELEPDPGPAAVPAAEADVVEV